MLIKTSPSQLPPVRRGGYRLYFFLSQSLPVGRQGAKPAFRRPTYRRQAGYIVLSTSYNLATWSSTNVECPTPTEECRMGKTSLPVRLPRRIAGPPRKNCAPSLLCVFARFILLLAKPACRRRACLSAAADIPFFFSPRRKAAKEGNSALACLPKSGY